MSEASVSAFPEWKTDWCFLVGLLALAATPLVVAPWLGAGNEAFSCGKAASLALAASFGAGALRHLRVANLTWADACFVLFWLHGCLAAAVSGVTLAASSMTLLPELASGIVMASVAVGTRGRPERRALLLDVMVVSCTVVATIALLEAMGLSLPWPGARRPYSTLGNRNFVGAEAALAAALAAGRLLARPSGWRAACLGLLVTAVGVSRCRSAWLALLVAALVVLLANAYAWSRTPSPKFRAARSAPGTFLAFLAISFGLLAATCVPWPGLHWSQRAEASTFSRLAEYRTGTGRERLDDWGLAAGLAQRHPFFGVGPRGWDDAASMHAHEVAGRHATPQHFWTSPNSDLARFAAERGLLGVFLLLCALSAIALTARRAPCSRKELFTLAGAFAVLAVNAALDAPLLRPSSLGWFGVLLGLARGESRPLVELRGGALRGLLSLVVVLLLVGTFLRARAGAALAAEPHRVQAMLQAQAWFWRPDVAEELSLQLAREGDCRSSELVGLEALAASPHHWGVSQGLAACWEKQGDSQRADHFAAIRDRIEPHLELLFATPGALYSGRTGAR